MIFIYDESWNESTNVPYHVLTYLYDCYYSLPERPDLASLFGWQAINHCYNEWLLNDSSKHILRDTDGITKMVEKIFFDYSKYYPLLCEYYKRIPLKAFHYIASYLLKGYVMDVSGFAEKYWPNSYKGLKNRIPSLSKILEDTYGRALCDIATPIVCGNQVKISADKSKSRQITNSFALKIKELLMQHSVQIQSPDNTNSFTYFIDDKEEIIIVVFGILYTSRCNNFHGNVVSRLNSINADKQTFEMYTDIFLIEYMLLAILLYLQGYISDRVLNSIKYNYLLMC